VERTQEGYMSTPFDPPCILRRKPDRRAASRTVLECNSDTIAAGSMPGGVHDPTDALRGSAATTRHPAGDDDARR